MKPHLTREKANTLENLPRGSEALGGTSAWRTGTTFACGCGFRFLRILLYFLHLQVNIVDI